MSSATHAAFQFSTPEVEVERAVSELRYGRPILFSSNERRLAVLALDAVAPSIYDNLRWRRKTAILSFSQRRAQRALAFLEAGMC